MIKKIAILLAVMVLSTPLCTIFSKASAAGNQGTVTLIGDLSRQDIDGVIATMDDEQVRRLLINEMKKQADQEAAAAETKEELTGIAALIATTKNRIDLIRIRIEELRSSGSLDIQKDLPALYKFIKGSEKGGSLARTIFSVVFALASALVISWLFRRYVLPAESQFRESAFPKWTDRLMGLAFRAFLDVISIVIFTAVVIVISFLFLSMTAPQRVLVITYLGAIVIVQAAHMLLKFLLAADVPALRILPVSDDAATYLSRWLLAIVFVYSFGLLTCGIFRIAGVSGLNYYLMITALSVLPAGMLIIMILQNKKTVASTLAGGKAQDSIQYWLAGYWHHAAIALVFFLLIFSMFQRLFYGVSLDALKTLLLIGLYFILDWLLRKALDVAFGIAQRPEDIDTLIHAVKSGNLSLPTTQSAATPETEGEETDQKEPSKQTMVVGRMKTVLRIGLRMTLLVYMLFWAVRIWGIQFTVGEKVSNALFSILATVLACYVVYELINAKIQRKLREEMPAGGDEMEEGGAGGSRIGTLLLLLQKFFLIVIVVMVVLVILSSLGVDIGPLIAGAGILGLAIGMGSQTLVKDIIAGIFFLMDDAFRVGEYVDLGGTKGMIEKISIRSLTLRHPRGMVNTVPFGDVGTVTNFSRDYIITKLDFRVPYDTDIEQVRKIIKKKVYEKIMKDEALGPKLLEPIKSQGVREMDDSAMIMRVKYKTAPGEQFAIRKEVYRLIQEEFKKAGIEFAHRNVTVYMPPEAGNETGVQSEGEAGKGDGNSKNEVSRQAAAAAALAAIQADEDEQADKKP
jgi:small-conductance mechanosensitive channel